MRLLKEIIQLLLMFILILSVMVVWFMPVVLSFWEWNFLYIFLYVVWWIPAMIYTMIANTIIELIGEL